MDDMKAKTPDIEGEFDAERAAKLIAKLRGEVSVLKESLAQAREQAERVTVLEEELESVKADNADKSSQLTAAAKEKLLREHGLPETLARVLTGEDADEWEETASLLAQLRAPSDDTASDSGESDPVVTAKNPQLVAEAAEKAAAARLFGH